MQLHHKIIHHLHRQKERIIAHVNRHHKKYIFGAGVALGIGALKVIAIIGIFLGIEMTVGRSHAANEEVQIYKELAIFNVIDDFVHQKYNDISAKKDPKTADLDMIFPILDGAYHSAQNLNEKHKAAKHFVDFLVQGHDVVKILGYTTPEEDKTFNEIVYEFYQIK